MPPYFLGRVMDFRTFNENADAAAERRAAMDQKRKEMADRLKDKSASYQKRKEPVKKGLTRPSGPTSGAYSPAIGAHRSSTGKTEIGRTFYSRDADED